MKKTAPNPKIATPLKPHHILHYYCKARFVRLAVDIEFDISKPL